MSDRPPTAGSRSRGWVRTESRWLGLDKRTIIPALVVVLVAVVGHIVLPLIDSRISYDAPAKAGAVMTLDRGVTFLPAQGWDVEAGVLKGEKLLTPSLPTSAKLVHGGVVFKVTVGSFSGSAVGLLAQVKQASAALHGFSQPQVGGAGKPVATGAGVAGMIAPYTSRVSDGVIAVFTENGVGVEVRATGPASSRPGGEAVMAMIESVRFAAPATASAAPGHT